MAEAQLPTLQCVLQWSTWAHLTFKAIHLQTPRYLRVTCLCELTQSWEQLGVEPTEQQISICSYKVPHFQVIRFNSADVQLYT